MVDAGRGRDSTVGQWEAGDREGHVSPSATKWKEQQPPLCV